MAGEAKRIDEATTRLVELDYVEVAISIDISLPSRSVGTLPRLADECEALVRLAKGEPVQLRPWVEVQPCLG